MPGIDVGVGELLMHVPSDRQVTEFMINSRANPIQAGFEVGSEVHVSASSPSPPRGTKVCQNHGPTMPSSPRSTCRSAVRLMLRLVDDVVLCGAPREATAGRSPV